MENNNMKETMERVEAFAKENSNGEINATWVYQEQLAKIMKKFADQEGTSFHAFVIEVENANNDINKMIYMTNNMISELTGIDVKALKYHYTDPVKLAELQQEDGLLEISGSVLKSNIFLAAGSSSSQNSLDYIWSTSISKKGSNSLINYSDGAAFTLNNNNNTILSLKSVMKLMLMMTKTPIATKFRNFVLNELVIGETAQETVNSYFEELFDKENIIIYSNNTEKLLELLEISYKYDLMNGIINKTGDPVKAKYNKINKYKEEFEGDIDKYKSELAKYKAFPNGDELFFEPINSLENKISETKRIIESLDTVCKTLLLRLHQINSTIKKLSSESNTADKYINQLISTIDYINFEYAKKHPGQNVCISRNLDSRKLNKILNDDIKLIDKNGVYAYKVSNHEPLRGQVISEDWTGRYKKEFINTIQSNQNRTGNDSDKYIKWTPFGFKLIGILLEKYYLDGWTTKNFLELTEDEWEKKVYEKYIEELMKTFQK